MTDISVKLTVDGSISSLKVSVIDWLVAIELIEQVGPLHPSEHDSRANSEAWVGALLGVEPKQAGSASTAQRRIFPRIHQSC